MSLMTPGHYWRSNEDQKVQPNKYWAELGSKTGWIIKSVGTEDVSKKSLQHTQASQKNVLMSLPLGA
jgi:hypothetical protein